MTNAPLFKLLSPHVIARHYVLLAILIAVNIIAWFVLLFTLRFAHGAFSILIIGMIIVMIAELVVIFLLNYGLRNSFSPSYKSVAAEFILSILSVSALVVPCAWSGWLLGSLRY